MTGNPLEVADAVARVLADIRPLGEVHVPLLESYGRVLTRDVTAPITIPAWDNSAMDGYAVRSPDVARVPAWLTVTGTVAAGGFPSRAVGPGEAIRVMTGAPVPDGADSVIRVEDTDGGTTRVEIRDRRDAGKNVRPRGEDVAEGTVAVPAGTAIAGAQVGVLAALGVTDVPVHRAPRVALLTSGDELVELDRFAEVRAGKKIVSSSSYALRALVRAAGGEPHYLGIAADTPASLREHLARARDADLVITTAGVSVGEYDHVRGVLAELGADIRFWRIRIRPGAPLGFGFIGTTPWIGLPGNPVSTLVTYELFARPAIRKQLGHARLHRRPVPVVLEEDVSIGVRLTHFLRAILTRDGARLTARLTGPQGSAILTSMSRANALLVVPPEREVVRAGETLHALPLGDDADFGPDFAL